MMVENNNERHRTAYAITVDFKEGTTTGISAHDRALTARKLADPSSIPNMFSRPGHLVPLRANSQGVLGRRGHTEAATGTRSLPSGSAWTIDLYLADLCALTGLPQVGLLCELVNDDVQGTMARRDDCRAFANKHGLKMISIEMLVQYRQRLEADKKFKQVAAT
jgi:3,4-dihydroxy-2-butanone 4-phosphate synthase